VVYVAFRRSILWRWWEYVAPFLAPGAYIYLTAFDQSHPGYLHYPAKGLGNLVELVLLVHVPSIYLVLRGVIFKKPPPHWAFVPVGCAAIALASAVFFYFPTLPE